MVPDIKGKLLPLGAMEKNIHMIAQRNFAVLDMSDRKDVTGKFFDPQVNLRVKFFTEHGDFPFEQVLVGT